MRRSKSPQKMPGRSGALAAAAVALALLGGCESIPDNLVPPPKAVKASEPLRSEWVEAQHQVPFAVNDARLSTTAMADIDSFLSRMDVGAGDRIAVTAETLGAPQTVRTLADRRRAAVMKYLQDRRFPAAGADMVATSDNANVWIRVGRYVVRLPDCPDWERLHHGAAYVDGPYKNFGCMTYTALGKMVIDPGDLAGGAPTGPADGAWMASGVQRYRTGKVHSADNASGGVVAEE
ncbi:MAG TPA: CpaD family pilus assembly lipoprotein [Alphaproteobacteria bacterium]